MSKHHNGGRLRPLRDRLTATLAMIGVLVMSSGLVVVTAGSASAHTPKFTATCSGVTAKATSYESKDTNTLSVTLDGVTKTKSFSTDGELTVPVPQDGEVHAWSASVTTTNSNPSYSKSDSGNVGPCGSKIKITAPAPKLTPPTCEKDGAVEWPAFDHGSWTGVTGTGVGPQSATPVADKGYELTNPGKVNVTVLGRSGLDCRTKVTPAAPKVVASAKCDVPGSVAVTPVTGVKYTWVKGSSNMTAGDYEIVATPETGYKFDGDQTVTYKGTLAAAKQCATPVNPVVVQSVECDVQGTWSVKETPGLSYRLAVGGNTTTVEEGKTYTGPVTGVVTAVADAGYELADAGWKYNLNLPAATDCPKVAPVAPVVVQSAKCDVPSTITLTPVTGVKYTWVKGAADMTVGDYEVLATPLPGYKFTGDQSQTYKGTLTAMKDCATPAEPSIVASATCDIPGSVKLTPAKGVKYEWVEGSADMTSGHFKVKATPEAGYAFDGPTQEIFFEGDLLPADACTAPAEPNLVQSEKCDVPGTVSTVPVTGVNYEWLEGSADMTEGHYKIEATPADGYEFTGNSQVVTYEGDLAPAKKCSTPVAPSVIASEQCNVPGSVSVVPTDGVLYTWVTGDEDMTEGPFEIEATPLAGYAFDGDQTVTYTGTLEPAEDCVKPSPTVKGTEIIKPSPKPHTKPTVKGTEQIVPTAIDAGLPGGGSSTPINLMVLLGQMLVAGGLMFLAAAGWTGLGRRNRGIHQA